LFDNSIGKSLNLNEIILFEEWHQDCIKISASDVRRWINTDQPKEEKMPGTSIRQRSGPEEGKPARAV
jgi:hypothetical protein